MIRFLISIYLSFAAVTWVVEEVKILYPSATPFVETFVEVVSIPTHDQWDPELVKAAKSAFTGTGKHIARSILDEEKGLESEDSAELAMLLQEF
jgi:hypothetical protein